MPAHRDKPSTADAWRVTRQRQAIFEYLKREDFHPTAEQVYRAVKKGLPRISFGTVYRNLYQLKDHGFIKEVMVDSIRRFESRVDAHAHFICERCGHVTDLDDQSMLKKLRATVRRYQSGARAENIEIRGVCRTCGKQQEPPAPYCHANGKQAHELANMDFQCRECAYKGGCRYC